MPFGRAKRVQEPLGEAALFEYAVKSLGARMQSVRDLRRKLKERAEPGPEGEEHMAAVIAKLVEMRYLSDERFAAEFTKGRQENRSFGRRRVQQDLQSKGIAAEVIAPALDAAYEDVDEAALVRQYLERKRIAAPVDEKSTARVLRRLVGAGFATKTIFRVLREMKSGESSLQRAEAAFGEE